MADMFARLQPHATGQAWKAPAHLPQRRQQAAQHCVCPVLCCRRLRCSQPCAWLPAPHPHIPQPHPLGPTLHTTTLAPLTPPHPLPAPPAPIWFGCSASPRVVPAVVASPPQSPPWGPHAAQLPPPAAHLIQLLHRAVEGGVPVLLVGVVVAGTGHVAHLNGGEGGRVGHVHMGGGSWCRPEATGTSAAPCCRCAANGAPGQHPGHQRAVLMPPGCSGLPAWPADRPPPGAAGPAAVAADTAASRMALAVRRPRAGNAATGCCRQLMPPAVIRGAKAVQVHLPLDCCSGSAGQPQPRCHHLRLRAAPAPPAPHAPGAAGHTPPALLLATPRPSARLSNSCCSPTPPKSPSHCMPPPTHSPSPTRPLTQMP